MIINNQYTYCYAQQLQNFLIMSANFLAKLFTGIFFTIGISSTYALCFNNNSPSHFLNLSIDEEKASTTSILGGEYASLNAIERASYEISIYGMTSHTQVTICDETSEAHTDCTNGNG